MTRLLVPLVLAAALAAAVAAPAGATNECNGLQVCIHVAGPWVVVPTGESVPRPLARFDLACPRGTIVAGLDAELSAPDIDLNFLATLGAPVNPGVSTSRSALFLGMYVGATAAAPTFRPHLGCMPTQGGGVRVPTSASVFQPGHPTVRRVKTVQVRRGTTRRVVQACATGERLVDAMDSVGFYTAKPPSERLVRGVRVSQSVRGDRVVVTAHANAGVGVRTVVQVGAVCAGGR